MIEKRFENPVTIELAGDGSARRRTIDTVRQAADCLMQDWPQDARGSKHRDALDICLKVLDGHRSTCEAEAAFAAAAWEAHIFVSNLAATQ